MWGGHIAHAVQPEANVFPLPDRLDLIEAAMIKLAAIAYRGLRESQPMPHHKVAVIGLGPIGMLSARLHHLTGAHVVAADLSAERTLLAERVGIAAVIPTPHARLKSAFQHVFPNGADIVIEATGSPAVLPEAIDLAKDIGWDDTLTPGARIIVQGSYPEAFSIPYQEAFLKCATFHLPRDQQPRDIRAVIDLLVRKKLVMRDLISAVRPPEAAPETYAELRESKGGFMTAVFQWQR
jgi:threonine dehydrogenase-like Zn-dependent dehydrogenase